MQNRVLPIHARTRSSHCNMRLPSACCTAFATVLLTSRTPAPICSASPPPRDLDLVCEEARASLAQALIRGKRGLSVETSMGSLDVTSRAYEPPVLARFALEISKALTVLDGEILVLLPGMSAAMQAKELLDGSALAWPAAGRDRVSVEPAPPYSRATSRKTSRQRSRCTLRGSAWEWRHRPLGWAGRTHGRWKGASWHLEAFLLCNGCKAIAAT